MKNLSPLLGITLLTFAPASAQEMLWEVPGHDWPGALDLSVDVNGDGFADAIIGDLVASQVTVRSGLDGSLLRSVTGSDFQGFGKEVLGIPDLNGDGYDEFGFTASSGGLRVHDGQTGGQLRMLFGSEPKTGLAALGDVNGDGYPDIAISHPANSNGQVVVVSGRYVVDGTASQTIWGKLGDFSAGYFGAEIARISDVDSDGVDDLIVGAPNEDGVSGLYAFHGQVYCLSGATGSTIWQKKYFSTESTAFGVAVAAAGDVNGDFVEDVLVGAPWNSSGASNAGAGFVLSGVHGGFLEQYYHDVPGDRFGSDVASAGDVDEDGVRDHLFGAVGNSSLLGKMHLFSGASMASIMEIDGGGYLGDPGTVSGGVDATGDGEPDFLITSPSTGVVELWGAGCHGGNVSFCTSNVNSSGLAASLHILGSVSITQNDMTVEARQCPPGKPGMFFYATHAVQLPFGDGFRCAGGPSTRLNPIVMVDSGGVARLALDLGVFPLGEGAGMVQFGDTRYFQYWFRDPMGPGGSGNNLTNGQGVTFCR